MNLDDFERTIQSQPIRKIPAEWRNQILSAARATADSTTSHSVGSRFSSFGAFQAQMVFWLWPSPKAWGALAAIWLLLLGANRTTLNSASPFASSGPHPTPAMIASWKEQEQILTELIQPQQSTAQAHRPAKAGPHSQRIGPRRMS